MYNIEVVLVKTYIKKLILGIMKIGKLNIDYDLISDVDFGIIRNAKMKTSFKPIIRKSKLSGNIKFGPGCRFIDVVCTGNIEIGRFVSLNGPATKISSRINGIKIGSFTSIASNVIIQEDYHRFDKISTYFMNNNMFNNGINDDIFSKGAIVIEEDVWVGANSVILSGVTIGRGSIIGAGSVVTKSIPKYSIVVGNPARVIRSRFNSTTIRILEKSRWWEWDIEKITQNRDAFNKNLNLIKEDSLIFKD